MNATLEKILCIGDRKSISERYQEHLENHSISPNLFYDQLVKNVMTAYQFLTESGKSIHDSELAIALSLVPYHNHIAKYAQYANGMPSLSINGRHPLIDFLSRSAENFDIEQISADPYFIISDGLERIEDTYSKMATKAPMKFRNILPWVLPNMVDSDEFNMFQKLVLTYSHFLKLVPFGEDALPDKMKKLKNEKNKLYWISFKKAQKFQQKYLKELREIANSLKH